MNEKYKNPKSDNSEILKSAQIIQNEIKKILEIIDANNGQLETISSEIENQLKAVFKQIKNADTPETVEEEKQKTTTITLPLNRIKTTINNVPNDKEKIELLQESANAINKIAFDKDGTLSVLGTNERNPSQQRELLNAFGIPHDGLTEKNLKWFQYEKEGGITQLSLSETDAATATKILEQYPHLKRLDLQNLTSAYGLYLSKNGKLENLHLNGLPKSQVPWKKIPASVTEVTTKEGPMTRMDYEVNQFASTIDESEQKSIFEKNFLKVDFWKNKTTTANTNSFYNNTKKQLTSDFNLFLRFQDFPQDDIFEDDSPFLVFKNDVENTWNKKEEKGILGLKKTNREKALSFKDKSKDKQEKTFYNIFPKESEQENDSQQEENNKYYFSSLSEKEQKTFVDEMVTNVSINDFSTLLESLLNNDESNKLVKAIKKHKKYTKKAGLLRRDDSPFKKMIDTFDSKSKRA